VAPEADHDLLGGPLLLDRRRVKFWQKIIFTLMAFLMVVFALGAGVTYIGCNKTSATVTPNDTVKKAAAKVRKNPDSPAARFALAVAWRTLGNAQEPGSTAESSAFEKSAAAFKKFLKLQTGKSLEAKKQRLDAALALVSIYTQLQDYYEVVQAYGFLTGMQPDNADNYILYGQAAEKAARNDVAILAYQKYLDLAPQGLYAKDVRNKLKQLEKQVTASPSP
jgi:tetratricopeptide (TPR) repeat protein